VDCLLIYCIACYSMFPIIIPVKNMPGITLNKAFFDQLARTNVCCINLEKMKYSSINKTNIEFFQYLCKREMKAQDEDPITKYFGSNNVFKTSSSSKRSHFRFHLAYFKCAEQPDGVWPRSKNTKKTIQDVSIELLLSTFNNDAQGDIHTFVNKQCYGVAILGFKKNTDPEAIASCLFDCTENGTVIHFIATTTDSWNKATWCNNTQLHERKKFKENNCLLTSLQ